MLPKFKMTFELESNCKETIGHTTKFIHDWKWGKEVEYKYEVNGTTFTKKGNIVFDGKEIRDIICPNGKYVVIYDSVNPINSEMDFKRPQNK